MQSKQFWLVFSVISIIMLVLNTVSATIAFQSYENIFQFIQNNISINSNQLVKLKSLISEDKLLLIKSLTVFITTLTTYFFIKKHRLFIENILYFFNELIFKIKNHFISIPTKIKLTIYCISIVKLVLILVIPLHLDEMFSYLFLANKGVLVSLSYYPGPNNHVFFNILSALLLKLSLPSNLAIRLPSLFSDIFILFICSKYVYQSSKSISISIICLIIISFSINYLPFSISARGYVLACCLGLIAFIASEKLKAQPTFYGIIYIVSNSLAFLTIPTHLYLFASIVFFQIFIQKNCKISLKINALTILSTTILYSPILILNGLDSLFNNHWVKSMSLNEFSPKIYSFLDNYISIITGLHYSVFNYLYLIIVFLLIYFSKSRKLNAYLFFYIFIVFSICVLQRVIPFTRVFCYLNLTFSLILVSYIVQNKAYKFLLIVSILTLFNNYQFIKNLIPFIESEKKIENEIAKNIQQWKLHKIKYIYIKEEKTAYQIQMYVIENHLAINAKWQPNQELPFIISK